MNIRHQKILAILPKCSGGLSLLSSSFIISDVLRDGRRRRSVYHRLVLGMSAYDALSSLWFFLSSWPMPTGSWYGAIGNQQTCNAQGFFIQLGLGGPMYNASLSLYYLLLLKYNWRESQIARRAEGLIHGVAAVVPISHAVIPFAAGVPYRPFTSYCTFATFTAGCKASEVGCRGVDVFLEILFRYGFFAVVWLCIIVASVSMSSVYLAVRRIESQSARYQFRAQGNGGQEESGEGRKKSRAVARSGILYVFAFLLCWTIPTLGFVFSKWRGIDGQESLLIYGAGFPFAVTVQILLPLQGVINLCIYVGPRLRKRAKRNPNRSFGGMLPKIFVGQLGKLPIGGKDKAKVQTSAETDDNGAEGNP